MREQVLETFASTKKRKESSGIGDEQDKRLKYLEGLVQKPLFF